MIVQLAGKVVDIPDDMIDKYDKKVMNRGGLIDYAIRTGQGKPSDFGLQDTKPEVGNAFNAAMISAGHEVSDLGSNAKQLMAEVGGNQAGAQQEMANQAEANRLMAPVAQEHPVASFAGGMLPYLAVPGGLPAQMAAGAATGALKADTPAGRAGGAALGAGMAYGGAKIGDKISEYLTPRLQNALGSRLGAARQVLADAEIPTTLGERGSIGGQFADVLKSTVTRGKPLADQQLRALTRVAAETLGEKSDELSKPVLSQAANRIGDVFEEAANKVGQIPIDNMTASRLASIDGMMSSVTEPSKVSGAISMVEDMLTNPAKELTGKSYAGGGGTLRHKLQAISSQLYKNGNGLEADVVDEIINTLDDAFTRAAPQDVTEKLGTARQQWRFLKALRRGDAVSDVTGQINPAAMTKAMESVYPGFDIGRATMGNAEKFGNTLDAFRQVVRPYKSSGTSERLTAMAIPVLAGLGLGGFAGPLAGGGAALALALSGGGTGKLLGGAAGRVAATQAQEKAKELASRLRQVP